MVLTSCATKDSLSKVRDIPLGVVVMLTHWPVGVGVGGRTVRPICPPPAC